MTTHKTRTSKALKPLVGSIAALLLCGTASVQAVSPTWDTNPVDGFWFNSSNWTPNTIPENAGDVANFGTSKITNVGPTGSINLGGITFLSGASAFHISTGNGNFFEISGAGVINQSGKTQNFLVGTNTTLQFNNQATAGSNTVYTIAGSVTGGEGAGVIHFFNNSTAGGATLIANGGGPGGGGHIVFYNTSSGGNATIQVYGNGELDISTHDPGSVTIGSLEGNGLVFLGSRNLIVGGNNQTTVFSGTIQDGGEGALFLVAGGVVGGSLTKVGTGTLVLNGVNTYTGNTNVNGGTLMVNGSIASPFTFVNPGGTLAGIGTIGGAVINNGLVAPGDGPGILTIKGNYTQSSGGLLIQIASPTVYGGLDIGGSASLGGTLFVQPLDPSKLKPGEKFQFLSAKGGIHGTFGKVVEIGSDSLFRFRIKYGADDLFLQSFLAPFTTLSGLTPNQTSVANELTRVSTDRQASKLINFLAVQPLNQLPGQFDQIAPEEYTSIFTLGESFDNVQSLNIQEHLSTLRAGTGGFSAGGLALNGFNVNYNGPIQFRTGVAGPRGDDGKESKEVKQVAPEESRWSAFLTGTGQWVGVSDDFNARGYDIATGGFTVGVDYKVCSHFSVGLMAGYIGTSIDLNDGGRVYANGGKLGLYATAYQNAQPAAAPTGMSKDSSKDSSKEAPAPMADVNPGWYADLAVTGGYSSYDVHRAALEGTARGSTDGGDLNVLVGAGYDFKKGGFTFGPTASFNYTYVGIGSFSETGSLAPLHFPSQGQESLRTAFGAKASYDWKVGGIAIKPEVRAAWQHEYGDAAYEIDSSFANGAGDNFTVNGPRIGRDSFLLGAGFAIQITERLSTYFYYDGELGRTRYDSHAVTGGVRMAF